MFFITDEKFAQSHKRIRQATGQQLSSSPAAQQKDREEQFYTALLPSTTLYQHHHRYKRWPLLTNVALFTLWTLIVFARNIFIRPHF